MDNIENLTKNLIDAIRSSKEYLEYQNAKRAIESDFEASNKINSFRKLQINTEIKMKQGIEISNDEKYNLQNMYTELTLDDNIEAYLRCERIVFETISDIYDELVNSIDMNLEFIE